MATKQEYAQWIVDNADKQGTPEFDTVAKAYELAKRQEAQVSEGAPNPMAYALPAVVNTAARAVKPLSSGAATVNARDAVNIAKNAAAWTPNALAEVVTHPISSLRAYVQGHPMANTPIRQIAGGIGKNVAGALVQGAVAPENILAAPYMMAGYEQAKIRENPVAPEYQYTPYAQQYRGEFPTQGAAGAANRRQAIAGQQYGGLTQEQQQMLEQDRIDQAIRRKAAEKVLGPIAPGQ
jgi:hypothetical protein